MHVIVQARKAAKHKSNQTFFASWVRGALLSSLCV